MIKNLRVLRNEKGISQQQLADVILVSQQSVNKYENHDVEPDIDILIKIADYFDVSLDYLVGRTDIKEMVTKPKMSDLSDKEAKFVQRFRCLKENQKDFVFQLMDSYKSDKE